MKKATVRTLVAAATASLALVAAGPASAEQNQGGSDGPKKGCEISNFGKNTTTLYPHGTVITVTIGPGQTEKWKCNDGQWEEVKQFIPRTPSLAAATHVGYAGMLVAIP